MGSYPPDPNALNPPSLQLASDEVHVWCISLDLPQPYLERFFSLLSPDEISWAERFIFERDRNFYITGRGLLRTILSGYLGIEPSQVQICYGQYGKPVLEPIAVDKILQFNLSHSHSMAVYTFSWNRRVGIDVEYIHPIPDEDRLAEHFFTARESTFLRSLSGEQKWEPFYKIWTCKEAYLKAIGDGLRDSIKLVEISLSDRESSRLASIDGDQEQASDWRLETFQPATCYQAALAVEGHDWQLVFQQFTEHFVL